MDYSKTETRSWSQMNNMNTVNYSMSNMFVNPKDNDNCIVPRVVLKLDYWHISISKPKALWVTNKNTDSWYCIDDNTEDTFWEILDNKHIPKVFAGLSTTFIFT